MQFPPGLSVKFYHIHIIGGPGSGKGTQCSKLVEDFGFVHLSAGDLLRTEVANGTEQGKELEALMKEGNLVPAVRLQTEFTVVASSLSNIATQKASCRLHHKLAHNSERRMV